MHPRRKYFGLRRGPQTLILMAASQGLKNVASFIRINQQLRHLGFSMPVILARVEKKGPLPLEGFGSDTVSFLDTNNR